MWVQIRLLLYIGSHQLYSSASELASWAQSLDNSAAALQVDCSVCSKNAECDNGHCKCKPGWIGDQPLQCYTSSNERQKPQLLMPLYTSPETDQYRKCSSFLWQRVAEQGSGTVAFVNINPDIETATYISCLRLLKLNSIEVYLRVSMEYGTATNIKTTVEDYDENFSDLISGYYIDNPPADLSDRAVTDLILKMKSLRRLNKVAISIHESEWSMKLLTHPNVKLRADLLVVFDSNHANWAQSCGPFGPGPYCKQVGDFKQRLETIQKRISSGRANRRQFAAIVYDVKADSVAAVLHQATKRGVGLIHVTNEQNAEQNMDGPFYWDFLFLNMKQNEKCGCFDLNECTSHTDGCHHMAACKNTIGSHTCQCPPHLIGDGRVDGTGCNEDDCAKCGSGTECRDGSSCVCDAGTAGTGLSCRKSNAVIPLSVPVNSNNDLCDDETWNSVSAFVYDAIDTTIIVELDVNNPEDYIACLELMSTHNVTILHEESLWNGFKVKDIVQVRIQRVMETFGRYVNGVYFSNTPSNLFERYGNIDYFADLVRVAKQMRTDFRVAVDVWDTEWPVSVLTGEMTDSLNRRIHAVDWAIVFRSNYADWYQDCSVFEEGPFCPNHMLQVNMVMDLENAIAEGRIKPEQLVSWIFNSDPDNYEKMFRKAHDSHVGSLFVTNSDLNAPIELEYWNDYLNSLKGLWAQCGCYDLNECVDGTHHCNEAEMCVNNHGGYSCFNPNAMTGFMRARPQYCTRRCDSNAKCIYGECECDPGYRGMGLDCTASTQSNKMVIPIRKSPKMESGKCIDPYWNEIAKLDKATVILEIHSEHWMPCIKFLTDNNIDVYGKISASNGKFKKMFDYLQSKVNGLHTTYKGLVNPFFTTPGASYETDWMYQIMEYSRKKNLKIGISGSEGTWSVNCVKVKKLDLVVVFKSRYRKLVDNCGDIGPGPFCGQGEKGETLSNEIQEAISSGKLSHDIFATIVYNANTRDIDTIVSLNDAFKINGVFITEKPYFNTQQPDMWKRVMHRIGLSADNLSLRESGDDCGCVDIDECAHRHDNCDENAACVNTNGGFECECNTGFDGDGVMCLDVNECSKGLHDCDLYARCDDVGTTFECTCLDGFTGDGKSCQDINECVDYVCDDYAVCTNTVGSYTCACREGTVGDGFTCTDVNECETGSHNCDIYATCSNDFGGFNCTCDIGFIGSGTKCVDIDECTSKEDFCASEAICANTVGSFSCSCPKGFIGDGETACTRDACDFCHDGAQCAADRSGCVCPEGTTGPGTQCSTSRMVIPLRKIPLVGFKSSVCLDEYWKSIAQLGYQASTVLTFPSETWIPCMKELRDNGADVYVAINARKGQFSNMSKYLINQINLLKTKFGDAINGIYIFNPGTKGFFPSYYTDVVSHVKTKNLKFGVETYKMPFDVNIVRMSDLVVVFKDILEKFKTSCGVHGAGPFCQRSIITPAEVAEIERDIKSGIIAKEKIAAMVFGVSATETDSVISTNHDSVVGSVFLSNFPISNTRKPAFWDLLIESNFDLSGASECGCTDIDECQVEKNPCPNYSTCFNEINTGFNCGCDPGYEKDNDGNCVDIDECSIAGACNKNAVCTNTKGGFGCVCASGYTGDGFTCNDINECDKEDTCDNQAQCTNDNGTFSCSCREGFSGDGLTCDDVDECLLGPCMDNGQCSNVVGGYTCACNDGYVLQDGLCVNVNECLGETECHMMAACFDTDGSYTCSCRNGFSGDGLDCSLSLCSLCDSNADCTGAACVCPTGYAGDAISCKSQSNAVIPLSTAPAVSVRTGLCVDPYWLNLGITGNHIVIADNYDANWLPCIKHVRRNLVDVYGTIYVNRSRLNSAGLISISEEIQTIMDNFKGNMNGIHFETDDRMLFSLDEWQKIFDIVRTAKLLISIEGYRNIWDLRTANDVDMIVIFKDDWREFSHNCFAGNTVGAFCRQNQVKAESLAKVESAIDAGYISTEMFVTMVFNVPSKDMEPTFGRIIDSISGSLYITSELLSQSSTPPLASYWNALNSLLNTKNAKMRSNDPTCGCSEIDECSEETHTCPDNSFCQNTIGSFQCTCRAGFIPKINAVGELTCVDDNECIHGIIRCDEIAQCHNISPGYACVCPDGFVGDGFQIGAVSTWHGWDGGTGCTDINECDNGMANCHADADCINTEGSYSCDCKRGFGGGGRSTGDGCFDVNECDMEVQVCHSDATCINKEPLYTCDCNTGFTGDGVNSCTDIDECDLGFHECHAMAICTNTIGSYTCDCIDEWFGNGKLCSQNICAQCDPLASCGNDCNCPSGYAGDGYTCSKTVVVAPIFAKPKTTQKTCSDEYWRSISAENGASVILEAQIDSDWLPCLNLFKESKTVVYAGVRSSSNLSSTKKAVSVMKKSFGNHVDGIYLSNFNAMGNDELKSLVDFASENSLLVAIDGHNAAWNLETANLVDLVVTFKGDLTEFELKCSSSLCQQDLEAIDDIVDAIKAGYVSRTKFATLIFDASENKLDEVFDVLMPHRMSRSIFVTDHPIGSKEKPSYFSQMVERSRSLLSHTVGERSMSSCGCVDVDECALGLDICPEHSACENTGGGYRCYCMEGFIDHVTWSRVTVSNGEFKCVDVNECADNADLCGSNMNCLNTIGSFECQCIPGYALGADGNCYDVDECSDQLDNCHSLSVCTNELGSFSCTCLDGYDGDATSDGTGCIDINECAERVDDCEDMGACTNTPGGYECSCPTGFTGDGFRSSTGCTDINECESDHNNCHIMATCTNTEGSYNCDCIEDWIGNGYACAQDVCSICESAATCDGSSCNCPAGYSGSGFNCRKNSLVVPIKNKPDISPHSKKCVDAYWTSIAANPENCVILEEQKTSWRPCLEMLAAAKVEIFLSLDTSPISIEVIKGKIDAAIVEQDNLLNGIMLTQPNTVDGFSDESFVSLFDYIKAKNLKVAIEGYGNVYNIETINRVDSVLLFKDNFQKYTQGCLPGRRPGPFCSQGQLSNQFVEELTTAMESNMIDSSKFISMVFDVDKSEVDNVIGGHYASSFDGGVFISDQIVSEITHRPSYFSYLSGEIRTTSDRIDHNSDCGCNEIDECLLGLHNCPSFSNCVNFDGGYSCSCMEGFDELITNGELSCIDVDECATGVDECNEFATCTNNVGSYICQCDLGYWGDGRHCEDIDECQENDGHCHDNSDCVNFSGGYACVCHNGFSGDGRLVQGCQDKNECELRTANCPPHSQCYNIEGGFICKCDHGFENHHGLCVDIDECAVTSDDCHPMAECTNLEGTYDCECVGDWHGDGRFCSLDVCSTCYEKANCDDEKCHCPQGYSGSGYECPDASAMALPINSKPEINAKSRECTDPYWLMVKQTQNSVVILEKYVPAWKPCMKMLLDQGTDVYLSVKTMKHNVMSKINFVSKTYRGRFNGFMFVDSSDLSGVNYARTLGFKVGVEMTTVVDYGVAIGADLVVIFKNTSDAFLADCGYYGTGPLCQRAPSGELDDIRFAIARGSQTPAKYISMVYNVPLDQIATVSNVHYSNEFNGGLFLTDAQLSIGQFRPTYFLNLVELINKNMIDSSPNCGCTEIDECAIGTDNCPVDSDCANTDGSFDCSCNTGYNGITKANGQLECVDINECSTGAHNCDTNAVCTNTNGDYECTCNDGYTGDGFQSGSGCNDQDECDLNIDLCFATADCFNTAGSYFCECQKGFRGNGRSDSEECQDIDECLNDPCHTNSICSNTEGSFTCDCESGFVQSDPEVCNDIDECETGAHNCHLMADCTNEPGSFSCACQDDWSGDGVTCSQNICNICDESAGCIDDSCQCPIGMSGSGIQCRNHLIPVPVSQELATKNGKCADPYVSKIIGLKNIRVILSHQTANSGPCVKELQSANVELISTIDAHRWSSTNMDVEIRSMIDNQVETFGDALSGILIQNPGLNGFDNKFNSIFNYIKNHGLQVAIEAYGTDWNLDLAHKVDYVIAFADKIENYLNDCGKFGPGPFCRSSSKTAQAILDAIENDEISSNKFGSLVYGVDSEAFGDVTDAHDNGIRGGLFVNNFRYPSSNEPAYFDHMVEIFNGQNRANCGCHDIDECALETHNCLENAYCNNIPRSYECLCNDGFERPEANGKCIDIDECANPSACPDLALCENTIGSFDCNCQTGYVLNENTGEKSCDDLDECTLSLGDCFSDETCVNTIGSFDCEPIDNLANDECETGAHICPAHSTCINTYFRINPTGYRCTCDEGFECLECYDLMPLDEFSCDDLNECVLGTANCDLESSACVNTIGSYECQCEEFEESDGQGGCVVVDPCAEGAHDCPAFSTCTSVMAGVTQYQCACIDGYQFSTGAQITCEDIDECAMKTHDCLASEDCNNLVPGYICTPGACQTLSCSHNCENNKCTCPDGMELDPSGLNCQIKDSEVDILCESDMMKVLVKKEFFDDLSSLQLNDPTCDLANGHIVSMDDEYFVVQSLLDSCGTTVEVSDTNIIFTNSLYNNVGKAQDESSGSWIRVDPIVTLKFSCLYQTVVDVDNTISVEPSFLEGSRNGRGNFHFNLQTYTDPEYLHEQTTGYKTGEIMYFDITIDREVLGIEFTVTDCTVFNHDKSKKYNVITEKCLDPYINARMMDNYVVARRARFSYTVFEFVGAEGQESITLTCKISICHPGDLFYSECAAGCPLNQNRKRRDSSEITVQTSITLN